MTIAAKKSRHREGKAPRVRAKVAAERFWIRAPNRELERTGVFILQNLPLIRKEAFSRGSAA